MLTEPDYQLFEAIDRHGPLPSHYLYEFTKAYRRDRSHHQNRLTEFYNGDATGSYLTRPPQQFASYTGRYQHVVYDLAPRSRRALAERGTLTSYGHLRHDPFVHRLMMACVSASFELAAPLYGLRYIPFQQILDDPRSRAAKSSGAPLSLPIGSVVVAPDLLFGLEYPEEGFRFFAVEIDRHTESIERRNLRQSSFARKVDAYQAALYEGAFRAHWGVPNLHVLTVTTSAMHLRNLCEYVRAQVAPELYHRFAFAVEPAFGADWRVPTDVLRALLREPWKTADGARALAP